MPTKDNAIKGLNLGGWLVLEKWMTPSLFKGSKAADEYTFCQDSMTEDKKQRLKQHRDTFITKKDIQWIAGQGFNAVRLPVGYWIFGGEKPYIKTEKYVNKLMDWAQEYDVKVLICLHGAPGSQNGYPHSGKAGDAHWHADPANIDKTVEIIKEIALKYGKHPNLLGIELLNEPTKEMPLSVLQDYYHRAYKEARKHCAKKVAIVMSDAYRPIAEWEDFINSKQFSNVFLDIHLYQIFSDEDKTLSLEEHISKSFRWKRSIKYSTPQKIIVGEWSAVLDGAYESFPKTSAIKARQLYVQSQLFVFAETAGHFYWNYKTEAKDDWNYRYLSDQISIC